MKYAIFHLNCEKYAQIEFYNFSGISRTRKIKLSNFSFFFFFILTNLLTHPLNRNFAYEISSLQGIFLVFMQTGNSRVIVCGRFARSHLHSFRSVILFLTFRWDRNIRFVCQYTSSVIQKWKSCHQFRHLFSFRTLTYLEAFVIARLTLQIWILSAVASQKSAFVRRLRSRHVFV